MGHDEIAGGVHGDPACKQLTARKTSVDYESCTAAGTASTLPCLNDCYRVCACVSSGGTSEGRHGFMTFILCCPIGTTDSLSTPTGPTDIVTGDWIEASGAYNSWGAAVDFCIAQGGTDLCPFEVYCPDGISAAPFGGRRVGSNGDDQW